ncbi:hypothetical protein IV203_034506 [Nitzschia inconspicua]|uniref:Uncharacterized protein n=1 Tax=Nitzschia inconspicua TaxID=303405 RepID=A0A9K3K665_9STRA|nr:hypothetical protein IV203_002697 [Nitzschia inconspicua]KAG7339509.1 hypothetical protein IV203_002562 [Nitzschia inconspicua]KAG7359408.1 hypothetical protein IV203_034506 [Nitzschia inconspicua]
MASTAGSTSIAVDDGGGGGSATTATTTSTLKTTTPAGQQVTVTKVVVNNKKSLSLGKVSVDTHTHSQPQQQQHKQHPIINDQTQTTSKHVATTSTNNDNNHTYHDNDNDNNNDIDDDDDEEVVSVDSTEVINDTICMALYYPSETNNSSNNNNNQQSSSPIWWPAIQFSSLMQFVDATNTELQKQLSTNVRNGTLTKRQKHDIEQRLFGRVTKEACYDTNFQTIYYLSRPLWEYRHCDPYSNTNRNKPVHVQRCTAALATYTRKMILKPWLIPSQQLYMDFHRATDQACAMAIQEEDNDDGKNNVPQQSNLVPNAIRVWDEWEKKQRQQQQQKQQRMLPVERAKPQDDMQDDIQDEIQDTVDHEDDDDDDDDDEQQQQEEEDIHHFPPLPPPPAHGSPMAQSIAAVSYTDASLESAKCSRNNNNNNHTPANTRGQPTSTTHRSAVNHTPATAESSAAPDLPPKLTITIPHNASFDDIWHEFQMEGWDVYQDAETQQMVYLAPNGYSFSSRQQFETHLQTEYGWQPPPPPRHSRYRKRQQSMDRPIAITQKKQASQYGERRQHHDPTSSSSSSSSGTITAGEMWSYVKKNLGWNYSNKPRDMPGNETWVYYRPGFNNKNRGILGQDCFLSEEDVLQYCLEHDIMPPPSPSQSSTTSSSSQEEVQEENNNESNSLQQGEMDIMDTDEDLEEKDTSNHDDDDDDSGYHTPTGQSPIPQDPGKPLERGPSEESDNDDTEDDNTDNNMYSWQVLWPTLQRSGWEIKKAANRLEDWWYCKPVRAMGNLDEHETPREGPRALQRGVDYFVTTEEVIAFCKERDSIRNKKKARRETIASIAKPSEKMKKPNSITTSSPQVLTTVVATDNETTTMTTTTKSDNKKRPREKKDTAADKNTKTKKQRSPPVTVEEQCQDEQLLVDDPTSNTAPWATNAPLFEHRVVIGSSFGITYHAPYYYLPGECVRNFSDRFENITELMHHLILQKHSDWNGDGTNSNDLEFGRYLRYVFVPGKPSEWSLIRTITKKEASFLLQKAGYSSSAADGSWKPPQQFVDFDILSAQYDTFELLCKALRCVENIESAGGETRRRKSGNLTSVQATALKLAIADGFASDEVSTSTVQVQKKDSPTNQVKTVVDETSTILQNALGKTENTNGKKKRAREEEDPLKVEKEVSPHKIKLKFRGKGDNPAPWVVNPLAVPSVGWHKCYERMGWKFTSNGYQWPGEKTKLEGFTRTSDLQTYICTQGDYDKYLDKLPDEDKPIVRRHFNYGHVPGTRYDWENLRSLTLREVIRLLNLLGFEKQADGSWTTPKGLPILREGIKYPSLSSLGQALVRVPDLEDRSSGECNRRRARKRDQILNEHQTMALRLRLAEGLEDEGTDPSSITASANASPSISPPNFIHQSDTALPSRSLTDSIHQSDNVLPSRSQTDSVHQSDTALRSEKQSPKTTNQPTSMDKVSRAMYEVCHHAQAWKYLQALGCRYYASKYHLPNDSNFCPQTQNELVEYILENSVNVLDWKCCTLTEDELKELEFYFRCFNAKLNNDSPIGDARKLLNKEGSIPAYLRKLGIAELENGHYKIRGDENTFDIAGLIHKIRASSDLHSLAPNPGATPRRRRSNDDSMLTDKEMLAVRLWSISIDITLENFPDESTLKRSALDTSNTCKNELEGKGSDEVTIEVIPKYSKITDLEEVLVEEDNVQVEARPSSDTAETSVEFESDNAMSLSATVHDSTQETFDADKTDSTEENDQTRESNGQIIERGSSFPGDEICHSVENTVAVARAIENKIPLHEPKLDWKNKDTNGETNAVATMFSPFPRKDPPIAAHEAEVEYQPDFDFVNDFAASHAYALLTQPDESPGSDQKSSPIMPGHPNPYSFHSNDFSSARKSRKTYGHRQQAFLSPQSDSDSPQSKDFASADNASAANAFGIRNIFK